MYEHKGLEDIFFIMLYGGVTLLAILSCCYLLFAPGNIFSTTISPSRELRRWAAAFLASVAASHIWWVLLGIYWLQDDRLVCNIVAISLDRLTFVPLMMCVLIRMLQDRRRPLWPVAVAMLPLFIIAVLSLVTRDESFEWYIEIYSAVLAVVFIIDYVRAMRKYNRWLRENFADLQHKEVWQSLTLLACILFVYTAYASNEGELATEYLAQVDTLIIIAFILWRVETLQQLYISEEEADDVSNDESMQTKAAPYNIPALLKQYCIDTRLYLEHDLTLQQLAVQIGTNRTYLSNYFAEQGVTYNTYINRLRIEHFIHLYLETKDSLRPPTAKTLAIECGFRSYYTFGTAFKKYKGVTVTEWINSQE